MKLVATILMITALLAPCAVGQESPNPLRFYLAVGPSIVAAPEVFRDDHKTGFHLATILGYSFTNHVEMMGRLELQIVSIDADAHFGYDVSLDGGVVDMLMLGTDVRLTARKSPALIRPFFFGGGGVSRMSQSDIVSNLAPEQYAPLEIDPQDGFYYNIGAGVTLKPMPTLTAFVLVRYLELGLDGDNLRFIPITFGVQF